MVADTTSSGGSPSAPVDVDERLHALDILRGLALCGMVLVHFHQKMRRPVEGLEDLIGWGVYVFVEQKAWGTFAFLFGVGFAILLRRLDRRGAPVVTIYRGARRALVRLRIWLTLRPLADAPATALLFGVEAAASRAWLARFRFGPLEWLWRTITYATRQPFYRIRPSRTLESV